MAAKADDTRPGTYPKAMEIARRLMGLFPKDQQRAVIVSRKIGVPNTTFGRWYHGKTMPKPSIIEDVCLRIGQDFDYIWGIKDTPSQIIDTTPSDEAQVFHSRKEPDVSESGIMRAMKEKRQSGKEVPDSVLLSAIRKMRDEYVIHRLLVVLEEITDRSIEISLEAYMKFTGFAKQEIVDWIDDPASEYVIGLGRVDEIVRRNKIPSIWHDWIFRCKDRPSPRDPSKPRGRGHEDKDDSSDDHLFGDDGTCWVVFNSGEEFKCDCLEVVFSDYISPGTDPLFRGAGLR